MRLFTNIKLLELKSNCSIISSLDIPFRKKLLFLYPTMTSEGINLLCGLCLFAKKHFNNYYYLYNYIA